MYLNVLQQSADQYNAYNTFNPISLSDPCNGVQFPTPHKVPTRKINTHRPNIVNCVIFASKPRMPLVLHKNYPTSR